MTARFAMPNDAWATRGLSGRLLIYNVPMSTSGKLVIVPTPIGNLGDMTLRSMEALREADVVCAEDTRVTGKLLAHLGIEKRLARLDEAMIGSRAAGVVERVAAGEVVAYCSDAGDARRIRPGAATRAWPPARGRRCCGRCCPAPSAAACAYVASGTVCSRFYFGGFFPRKATEQRIASQSFPGWTRLSCSTRARTGWWRRFRSSPRCCRGARWRSAAS